MAYGTYSGLQILFEELIGENKICQYGVRIIPGVTDAYELKEHRSLVEKLKIHIKTYNKFMAGYIKNQ